MRVALRSTTVVLLVLSLGLHWALLQTVAWTGMLIAYSQDGTVREAVTKTFDGNHPCPLCRAIQQGREEERQQEDRPVKLPTPVMLALVWQPLEFDFRHPREAMPTCDAIGALRREPPPKPHPRPSLGLPTDAT